MAGQHVFEESRRRSRVHSVQREPPDEHLPHEDRGEACHSDHREKACRITDGWLAHLGKRRQREKSRNEQQYPDEQKQMRRHPPRGMRHHDDHLLGRRHPFLRVYEVADGHQQRPRDEA
jgi:hypothetical protein